MKKPKILQSLKRKKKKTSDECNQKETPEEVEFQSVEPKKEKVLAEHHEVLHSGQRDALAGLKQYKHTDDSIIRSRNVESHIDTMGKESSLPYSDIDKKVDRALQQKVPTPPKKRKPANVIYVVSKPQPGQTRGDWAVRSHRKIFSHHRTKEMAIKKAREIAAEREATVLVQNMDGTFRTSYKPRPKK